MSKKPKLIEVGNGYSVRFDQRAKGQETPYYVGVILKDGKEVGYFNNDGRGGKTLIMPHQVSQAFHQMVVEAAKKHGKDFSKASENDELVIEFAEMRGYRKGCAESPSETFDAFIKQVIKDEEEFRKEWNKL